MKKNTPEDWKNTSKLFNLLNSKPTPPPSDNFYKGFPRTQEELDQRYKEAKKFWKKVFVVAGILLWICIMILVTRPEPTPDEIRFQENDIVRNCGPYNIVPQVTEYLKNTLPNPDTYSASTWSSVEKNYDKKIFEVKHSYYAVDENKVRYRYEESFELDTLGVVINTKILTQEKSPEYVMESHRKRAAAQQQ